MEDNLTELVDRLRRAHGPKLVSVVLYGSAASGDNRDEFSDLNVLSVLTQVTPTELSEGEPIFEWWRKQGNPAPLLMSEEEVQTSTDCFAIEFHDMQERRRVLFGKDLIQDLLVDRSFYRAQVEYQLRAKLLRLRQKASAILNDKTQLVRLMADSVSTFCVLSRHALLLSGIAPAWEKRAVAAKLRELNLDGSAFEQLIDVREKVRKPAEIDATWLFSKYLKQIEAVIGYVDRLEK